MIDWDKFFRENVKPGKAANADLPDKIAKLLFSEPKEERKASAHQMAIAMEAAAKRRATANSN